jgi:hypothetical protein
MNHPGLATHLLAITDYRCSTNIAVCHEKSIRKADAMKIPVAGSGACPQVSLM